MGKNRRFGLLFVSWMAVVTAACLLPSEFGTDTGLDFPNADKFFHFTFYLIGMLLGGLAARERLAAKGGPAKPLAVIFVSLLGYGLLIEGLQAVLPTGRSAEWLDAGANTLGLLVAVTSLKWLFHETEFLKWRD